VKAGSTTGVGHHVAGVAVDDEHAGAPLGLPVEQVGDALGPRQERPPDRKHQRRFHEDDVVFGDAAVVDVRRPAGADGRDPLARATAVGQAIDVVLRGDAELGGEADPLFAARVADQMRRRDVLG